MTHSVSRARLASRPSDDVFSKRQELGPRALRARGFTPLEIVTGVTHSKRVQSLTGFTLIELIIVIALVAVVAEFGMSFSMSSIARSNVIGERDLFVALLTQARARSLANVDETAHGVEVDEVNNKYIIYRVTNGGAVSGTRTNEEEIPMITDADFSDNPNDFLFQNLTLRGMRETGNTTISLAGQSYTVDVNSSGRIEWLV